MTLQLRGKTLSSDSHPRLSALRTVVQLRAQPMGALSGRVRTQLVALYNLSSDALAYAVDADCVAAANAAHTTDKFEQDPDIRSGWTPQAATTIWSTW